MPNHKPLLRSVNGTEAQGHVFRVPPSPPSPCALPNTQTSKTQTRGASAQHWPRTASPEPPNSPSRCRRPLLGLQGPNLGGHRVNALKCGPLSTNLFRASPTGALRQSRPRRHSSRRTRKRFECLLLSRSEEPAFVTARTPSRRSLPCLSSPSITNRGNKVQGPSSVHVFRLFLGARSVKSQST